MLRLLTTIGVGLLVASTSFAQTSRPNPATSPAETTVPNLDQQDSNFIKEAAAGGVKIIAENRKGIGNRVLGARFVVRLPRV